MPDIDRWEAIVSRWMANANFTSWIQLQRASSLSRYRIQQFKCCEMKSWPIQSLESLCGGLNISLTELLAAMEVLEDTGEEKSTPHAPDESVEIHRQSTLRELESLLRQLPTASYAAQHHNLPAERLLSVLKPLDVLLAKWDVSPLGEVGQIVPFDSSWQVSLADETYENGTPVSVRYVGYRVQNKIWLKAQVRAVASDSVK